MGFLVSPGVQVKEIDLTNVVPAVATSIGAVAGPFAKGPVGEITTIGSEEDLLRIFGKPNNSNFEWWFTSANFLQYTNSLRVVRVESGILNACSEVGLLIRSLEHYEGSFEDGQGSVGPWAARTAGSWGNSLEVSICATSTAYEQNITGANQVNGAVSSGGTTVTVDDVDLADNAINVGDIVSFFTDSGFGTFAANNVGFEYEVTKRDTANNTITIRKLDDPNGSGLNGDLADNSFIRRRWKYYDLFDGPPGTTAWSTENGRGTADEMHVVVSDTTGDISGFANGVASQRTTAVLETYSRVSKNSAAKTAQGSTNYYKNVINTQSSFIYWMDHLGAGTNWGSDLVASNKIALNGTDATGSDEGDAIIDETDSDYIIQDGPLAGGSFTAVDAPTYDELTGGTDDYAVTHGELELAYDKFADPESIDINLVLGGPSSGVSDTSGVSGDAFDTHGTMLTDLVELRKDCVAFISPARSDVVNVSDPVVAVENVKKAFDTLPSSSYVVYDSGYKYMYDKYNDVYRYVPLNGDIAGLCANTDTVADPWFSPAGYNRGNIRGAIKLAFNPQQAHRDILYRARINPVTNFPGQGVVLFGDKTALAKPSAFDRINVRRLFLVLEKAIATAAKFQLFEFNDEFTRAQFRNLVEPFLRDVQGRRGIFDFKVVCDGTNNTGEVIDRNEFIGDIYIKPARSINFITLNFVAVRTGVSFSEVVGQF